MAPAYKPPTPEEKEAYVTALFDQIAENYDAMNQVMSAGQWSRWHRKFVAMTDFEPGDRILDVACGTGDLSMLDAAQVQPGGSVVGIDISEGMMEVGRRRIAATPYKDAIVMEWGNVMELKYDNNSFDGATMGWAMRNVASIPQTLSEIYRVLKPGGRFVCLEAARPYSKFVRFGFFLYWKTLLPLIDWAVVKTGRQAKVRPYTYLSRSLDSYPFPHELEQMFKQAGFQQTDYKLLMMGSVAIHVGTK
ncbi:MAG TPA: bifunctional demethylmenaquinone methyltransferase/2-methoxy-6-polyprenyl-1,4-benzoquinol methylase UbiE [Candidatus Sulfotelmatobacter sp.]|nr:bifunctional demethylmenaquinone methyltransferase/2-methoxy-6-polyprenyl-1,4-benzoquinol methylase UbiE [Candidatus Sulfotelmatobacter sp.]HWI62827.1 bifunctional demethylmenaquinone methyltransferase/2-methoxy-6-polyprenyl-1,4-benzoquinol methylase UbiE [Symbiobacteriaceae bacterium]